MKTKTDIKIRFVGCREIVLAGRAAAAHASGEKAEPTAVTNSHLRQGEKEQQLKSTANQRKKKLKLK